MRRMRVPENENGRCPWRPSVPGATGKGSGFSAQDDAEQGCCSSLPLGHIGKQNPREALPGGWARQQWVTRSRELGGTTRVKLGSAAAARPARSATTSTGDAPREQGQDGAWALLRQRGAPTPTAQGSWEGAAVARSRAGSSWHRAERGPRVPSAPARTGCSRPCRRLLPGSVSHAPVCCRPLHPPLTPSHLSQSSPKSPEPPPARRCLAAVRVFPAAAPLCQSADFQRLHDPCGSLSAREIFRIYDCKQPRLSCTPIIHTQRLRLQAEMRTQMEWDGQTGLQVMPPLSALPWQRALSSTPFL